MAAPSEYKLLSDAAVLSEVRTVLSPNSEEVVIPMSGDEDGSTDTEAIQTALTARKTVRLAGGAYYINAKLTVQAPAKLVGGEQGAILRWAAAATTDPMILVQKHPSGTYVSYGESLEDLVLYCGHLCRGVKFSECYYRPLARNLQIEKARQIALDVYDCWGSTMSSISVVYTHGVAMRVHRCNSATFYDVRLDTCHLFWHTSGVVDPTSTQADNVTLWKAAGDDGIVATRTSYGAACLEDWPSTDDIAAVDRAVLVIDADTDLAAFHNLIIESPCTGDLPVVMSHGEVGSFTNVRCEAGYQSNAAATKSAYFHFVGVGGNAMTGCYNLVDGMTVSPNTGYVNKSFIRLDNTTVGNTIRRAYGYSSQMDAAVAADSNVTNTGIVVTSCGATAAIEDVVYDA